MLVDISTALFALGIFGIMLENLAFAVTCFMVAFYCVS